MMLEKNERESTKLLCFYSQSQDWLIHFQELDTKLGTKFLQKGAGSFRDHLKGLCPRLQTDLKRMNFFKVLTIIQLFCGIPLQDVKF